MRRQDEAMRIMEALSGVDEELLARCEAAGRRTGKTGKQSGYARRYLGRCAAALVLAAVGIVSWKGFQVSRDMLGDNSMTGGSPEAVSMENFGQDVGGDLKSGWGLNLEILPEEMPEMNGIEGAVTKSEEKSAFDSAESDGLAPESGDITDYTRAFAESLITGCPMEPAKKSLTEEEARQVEILGDYVPVKLPAGYVFESAAYRAGAGRQDDEEVNSEGQGRLTVCWSRGMDGIVLSIWQADGDAVKTVDVRKAETYDERLYEIPYGESVPAEYREDFLNPVFAKDDFSLEIVRSRVISYSGDSGDTATPRGCFSVLYDGVMVSFNGRGTPEEIWEMFASMAE